MEKLLKVISELKVAKNQYNSFGGYHYRSCEDILEAVKPLLHKHGLLMTITDNIVSEGGRVYVQAFVTVTDGEWAKNASAFAREAEHKKGMDDAQVTGSASSYARKYALNGMFLIDDTKDADTEKPPVKLSRKDELMEEASAILKELKLKDGKRDIFKSKYNAVKTEKDAEAFLELAKQEKKEVIKYELANLGKEEFQDDEVPKVGEELDIF